MKKPKQTRELAGKNDTEFSSTLTPDINGGRKSVPHAGRFDRERGGKTDNGKVPARDVEDAVPYALTS